MHALTTHQRYAQNAATGTHRARSFDELRMALEDKARARRIAELRNRKHLTQQAMAERLQIAIRTYQSWEAQKDPVMPDWPNLEKLALFHGVRPEDIIGETEDLSLEVVSQLDRIEASQTKILAELRTIRLELARPSRRPRSTQPQSRPGKKATGS